MGSLNIFTDICNWWWLAWLLPFILGLMLGWAVWAKFAKKARLLQDELAVVKRENREVDARIQSLNSDKNKLISDLNTSQKKIKDLEFKLSKK